MNKLRKFFWTLPLTFVLFVAFSCDNREDITPTDTFSEVEFVIPASLEVEPSVMTATLEVKSKTLPEMTDKIMFTDAEGLSYSCTFTEITAGQATIKLAKGVVEGDYSVTYKREQRKRAIGKTKVKFLEKIVFEPDPKSTVYGKVTCDGVGVKGVVVSDGYLVVTTNDEGIYEMQSAKEHGYVFMSVPSGYEPGRNGILPKFYATLEKGEKELERADFSLTKVDQTKFKLLVMGDQHLANRTNDKTQYNRFINDVNSFVSSNSSSPIYGITLGDMTWDLYWYTNKFCFPEYLSLANNIKNLTIYHTIGNHDHDMAAAGDFNTVVSYKRALGPTYYSFNIGKWHIIALDNIECTNDGSGTSASRTYNVKLVNEEINWLIEDMKHVPADASIIVTMHAPMYTTSGSYRTDNATQLASIFSGHTVHYYTGHTHVLYNVDKLTASKTFEHNSGAVCATWWWSGYETSGVHLSQDGTPGGYMVVDINGSDMKWQYKAVDATLQYQFRSYDRNTINLDAATWCPSATGSALTSYNKVASGWLSDASNYVYLNVWDYDPSWKVEVTENGTALTVSKVAAMDPLHIVSYTAKRANKNASVTFATESTAHMFRVKASSATSTLQIKVTDRFGNVYTETMTRPKAFTTSTYALY